MGESADPSAVPPELLADYRRAAAAQLAGLKQCADRLTANPGDRDALDTFRREVHKIRGSAGSYGFPLGTELAATMEETAKDWLAHVSDTAVDRGGLVRWFVTRLTEIIGVTEDGTPVPPAKRATVQSAEVPEVICVEDDQSLAELLEYGLRSRGYRFQSYRDGAAALAALLALDTQGRRPLVLLDVDLPGLDGFSLLQRLEHERPGAFRVVITSVHGQEDEQVRGLEAGALDYLVKPISLRVALEKIRRWVGR